MWARTIRDVNEWGTRNLPNRRRNRELLIRAEWVYAARRSTGPALTWRRGAGRPTPTKMNWAGSRASRWASAGDRWPTTTTTTTTGVGVASAKTKQTINQGSGERSGREQRSIRPRRRRQCSGQSMGRGGAPFRQLIAARSRVAPKSTRRRDAAWA